MTRSIIALVVLLFLMVVQTPSYAVESIKLSGRNLTWFNPKPYIFTTPTGTVWFDRSAKKLHEQENASGLPIDVPGVALPGRKTLEGWWLITLPDGQKVVTQQVDIGPRGKGVLDLNAALASQFYDRPQDVTGKWSAVYLGRKLPDDISPGLQK
jgi:hypothetical protein